MSLSLQFSNESISVDITTSQLQPDIDFITRHGKLSQSMLDNYIKTNTRTVLRIKCKDVDKELDSFLKLRTALFKYQYKLPMKYLKPDAENRYIAQKSMLIEDSNRIESAYKQIEPFNIGFDNYIQLIPINQDLELGTVYVVDVNNDYNELTRKFFRSASIKTSANIKNMNVKYDFCKNIHIGTLDIGSNYRGKFVVTMKPEYSDCLCKYNFKIINDNEFELIYYDFIFNFADTKVVLQQLVKETEGVM